jgi:hypothetical protein
MVSDFIVSRKVFFVMLMQIGGLGTYCPCPYNYLLGFNFVAPIMNNFPVASLSMNCRFPPVWLGISQAGGGQDRACFTVCQVVGGEGV